MVYFEVSNLTHTDLMEPQMQPTQYPHMNRFVLAFGALGVAAIGGVVGSIFTLAFEDSRTSVGGHNEQPIINYQVGGADVAQKQREANLLASTAIPLEEMHSLVGAVVSISNNCISLEIPSSPNSTLLSGSRTAVVAPGTKIFKVTQKDLKIFQSEMEDYNTKKAQVGTDHSSLKAPAPSTRTLITLTEIPRGAVVVVTSPEDIRATKEFSVSQIEMLVGVSAK